MTKDKKRKIVPSDASAIVVRGVSKEFRVRSERQRMGLLGGWGDLWARKRRLRALDGLDLTVDRGEMLGIIGMNGSGKSTLLKIIAGIVSPTAGSVEVIGRIGSLIELGAGFHPDLSGYENVHLNGSILGMDQKVIGDLLPQIVEFAGLEPFMEMPVKYYSSGMYMRLGFAIAIQLQPEILLLDEILSVGDAEFQSRALGAIKEFRASGATTLLVSHDIITVREYCDRVLWLHRGRIHRMGDPRDVVDAYRDDLTGRAGTQARTFLSLNGDKLFCEPAVDDSPLEIARLSILDERGRAAARLEHPREITLSIGYRCRRPVAHPRVCVGLIRRESNAVVVERDSVRDGQDFGTLTGPGTIRLSFEAGDFYSDSFRCVVAFYRSHDGARALARATVDFNLDAHVQTIPPESVHYILAPCRAIRHTAGSDSRKEAQSEPS